MDHQALHKKINWLILFRFLVILAFVAVLPLLDHGKDLFSQTKYTFQFLSLVAMLNIVYFMLNRWWSSKAFLIVQCTLDCIIETVLIYLTGGITSTFAVVFFATILAAAIMVNGRFSLACASLATVGLAAVAAVFYYYSQRDIAPFPFSGKDFSAMSLKMNVYVYHLLVQSFAFFLVAFLGGKLSDKMREDKIVQDEILQALGEGVIVSDNDNKVVYINHCAEELLSTTANEIMNKDLVLYLNTLSPSLARCVMNKEESLYDLALKNGSGHETPYQFNIRPLRGIGGRVRGMTIMINDRTVNKELSKSRLTVTRMKALSEMGAGIAHEIRNPLASICGSVQELSHTSMDDTDQQLMSIILKESDRLNNIITDFLKFASLKKAIFYPCDIKQLLQEIVFLFSKRDDVSQLTITMTSQDQGNYIAHADSEQIRQVFLNLLLNSAEAMDFNGEINISLSHQSRVQGQSHDSDSKTYKKVEGIMVSVQDNGPGISDEAMEKLFLPFYTTKQLGTGMGLAIASRIVSDHQGTLSVDSVAEQGCTFGLWLPATPIEDHQ